MTEPHYLDNLRAQLKLDPSSQDEIIRELYTHFEERVRELKEAGLSEEEAAREAALCLGPAKAIAEEMNQIHSVGNWAQAIVAAIPHILFSLLFAFHQWHNLFWLSMVMTSIFAVVIYGWKRNKPNWVFSWLGYALLPLLLAGFVLLVLLLQALSLLPSNNLALSWWVWVVALAYFPFALWLFFSITTQVMRRDWLLVSLIALPFPAIAGWLLVVQQQCGLLVFSQPYINNLSPLISLSFVILASVVILFIRLSPRPLKVGSLLIGELVALSIIASSSPKNVQFLTLATLALAPLAIFLAPVVLKHGIEQGGRAGAWAYSCLRRASDKP